MDHYRQSPYHQQVLDKIQSHLDDPKHNSVNTTYGHNDSQLLLADKAKPAKYPTLLYKYAFQGMALNEFWDQPYHCMLEELMPPLSVDNFNLPYPQGFQGAQVCPMTWGTNYGIDKWGMFNGENIKWAMVPTLIGWYIIFNTITYLGMQFYHHAPPSKLHMKEVLYSTEEERKMEEFNIKDHKVNKIVNASKKKCYGHCGNHAMMDGHHSHHITM